MTTTFASDLWNNILDELTAELDIPHGVNVGYGIYVGLTTVGVYAISNNHPWANYVRLGRALEASAASFATGVRPADWDHVVYASATIIATGIAIAVLAARSRRDRGAAGQGARLFTRRCQAHLADASRPRSCRRHSGLSESEGACSPQGARHGGRQQDRLAKGPLHHGAMAAWPGLGVLRRGRRRLVRLQGRACARRSRAGHSDDPVARPHFGHCGIAVRGKDKWLLHAGDAYFFHGELQPKPRMPFVLGIFQRRADMDCATRISNRERLRSLKAAHGADVTIFNSHDPVDYENCRCGQAH
jgi:hypothetical protein